MVPCVFCSTLLTPPTKRQHFIQDSIGGTMVTTSTTCDACNAHFADTTDKAISKKFRQCMNILSFALRHPGPNVSVRKQSTGGPILLQPGGVPKGRVEINRDLANGRVIIRAPTTGQADRARRTTGKTAFGPVKITYQTEEVDEIAVFEIDPIHMDELRSATKTAIEYLVHKTPDIRPNISIAGASRFALGEALPMDAVPVILPNYPKSDLLAAGFFEDPFAHRIWIQCDSSGIHCLVDLLSSVAYRFRLGDYSGKPLVLQYQKNILKSSPDDMVRSSTVLMRMPEIIPMDDKVVQREDARLRKLYIDAGWYVDLNCKDDTVRFYQYGLRNGKSPGDIIDIDFAQLVDLVCVQVRKAFKKALGSSEPAVESRKIMKRLSRLEKFRGEKVDGLSDALVNSMWALHREAFDLHKKYVGEPDYGHVKFDKNPFA